MSEITICPICESKDWQPFLQVKDHSISQELFTLKQCRNCTFVVTSPRPEDESLSQYYLSDNYISHSGKSNSLINSIYLIARNYSLRWKLRLINELQSKGSALDIGCGTGEFLFTLKNAGWNVSGVEPSDSARLKAQELIQKPIASSIDQAKGPVQLITLWHVLEHLSNLDNSLKKMNGLLDKKGTLLIAVPNLRSHDAQKYKEYWAGYDVPRHLWHFSQETMVLLLQNYGFTIVKTIPMKLDAYYVSMLSEKYRSNASTITNSFKGFLSAMSSNKSAKKTGNYSSLIYVAKK